MDWIKVLDTFNDELEKIAEFDLRGMSPESVLTTGQPREPMPSAAYDKAMAILDRVPAPMAKVADVVNESKEVKKNPYVHSIRPVGKAALTGAAAGGLAASLVGKTMKTTRVGVGAGAALGVLDRMYVNHQKSKLKKHAMISPGMQLRASKAVGVQKNIIHAGKSLGSQLKGSLIGRKFTPPTL